MDRTEENVVAGCVTVLHNGWHLNCHPKPRNSYTFTLMNIDARTVWGTFPAETKRGMAWLLNAGLMAAAREEVTAEAERMLPLTNATPVDMCCALELAAENWIKRHGFTK